MSELVLMLMGTLFLLRLSLEIFLGLDPQSVYMMSIVPSILIVAWLKTK